jgi:glyoxylase-like metal-dependent hydrolase (beta-lactamase superfamily II)
MAHSTLIVTPIETQPILEVTYLVRLADRSDCVVVDPGLQPDLILRTLAHARLTVAAILNTHGHGDHIGGNDQLKRAFPAAPLIIGELDAPMLADPMLNLSAAFGMYVVSPPANRTLREGDVVEAAGLTFDVLHLPGHSPGHVVFVWRSESPPVVLGGDVLFAGSVGRTDLPGGDHRALVHGIRSKLFALPNDTIVYPGHGPPTTVGTERQTNPFVGDRAGRIAF